MKPLKVVVANSVGRDPQGRWIIHFPSRWSFTLDGAAVKYTYYPYELAYLSSLLKRDTPHAVKFLDGNLRRWSAAEYVEHLAAERPDVLVMETATVVYAEDLKVARELRRRCGTRLVFAGQHAAAFPERLRADGIDHVCLGEYELTVRDLLRGADPATLPGLYPNGPRAPLDVDDLPLPEDDDVRRVEYTDPPLECCDYHEFEVFASRGCPLSCSFCVSGGGGLYYPKPNWRTRSPASVVAEIRHLRERYPGMQGVFFNEEMHNARKSFVLELCAAIRAAGLDDLRYQAMCGYWSLDPEQLAAMKAAGYYKLRLGIESVSQATLDGMNKRIRPDGIAQVLRWARAAGLKVYGTFMFGAPGSTAATDEQTLAAIRAYAREGLLEDLQVSIATPQPGTRFYHQAREEGWLQATADADFDGNRCAVVSYPHYPSAAITAMHAAAQEIAEDILVRRSLTRHGLLPVVARSLGRRGVVETLRIGARFLRRQGTGWVSRLRAGDR